MIITKTFLELFSTGVYYANHVTLFRCRRCHESTGSSFKLKWTSESTAHGFTPLTQKQAQSFISDDVLVAVNARAMWGSSPQADGELGEMI
jgi:hypothetical protein